jgi:serine phosphatase RsbU (regulator of sigma subunit)
MAQVRAAVRAYLALDPDPSAVLERMDRFFARFELAQIVTLAYLVLDADADQVEIGNAGHLPPLIVDPSGAVTMLPEPQSPPIGTGPQERASSTVPFPPGTTLLVYTDGLVERRTEDIDAGLDRLVVTAKSLAAGPLEDGLAGVIESLAGGDRDDDVTAVAVRRCPD